MKERGRERKIDRAVEDERESHRHRQKEDGGVFYPLIKSLVSLCQFIPVPLHTCISICVSFVSLYV